MLKLCCLRPLMNREERNVTLTKAQESRVLTEQRKQYNPLNMRKKPDIEQYPQYIKKFISKNNN